MKWSRVIAIGSCVALASVARASAQEQDIRGYYLNVATGVAGGAFNESAASDLQRLRLMASPTWRGLDFDFAYEHSLNLQTQVSAAAPLGLGVGREPGMWLGLQGTLESTERLNWRHRIDRAAVRIGLGPSTEVTVGRQPVSWATTLLLTPADPFVPFDVEDPFREYRTGVDALRVQTFLGAFTDVDVVLRPADFSDGNRTITALGRVRSVIAGTEVSAWAGALHDEAASSVAVTATFVGAAARAEFVVREIDGETRTRLAIGLDRGFIVAARDLYVVLEVQRDELGAASRDGIPTVLASGPASRGELLVLGRDAAAVQFAYAVHPLWSVDLLTLANLNDPSALLGPAVSHAPSGETNLRLGIFVGLGHEADSLGQPGSEFGAVPWVGYLSFTAFF